MRLIFIVTSVRNSYFFNTSLNYRYLVGNAKKKNKRLNICMISYRSNPTCGGQGVYINNLSRALKDKGHNVDVIAGPPYPLLHKDVTLTRINTLDLYNPNDLFRTPSPNELKNPINVMEWLSVCSMGYPEPFTFGVRAYAHLRKKFSHYDIVHDNQSLSYGIYALSRILPTVATIHHPITIDRTIAVKNEKAFFKKLKWLRWYSFIGMQKRVAKRLPKIITVSEYSKKDIQTDFKIKDKNIVVVPNGIETDLFYPIPETRRDPGQLIVTNSADTPLKGLKYLLHAISEIAKTRRIKLMVIGTPKKNGEIENIVKKLGIGGFVKFTGRVTNGKFVKLYAKASIAIVPSLYEGFGLPVGEAMSCRIPVICTSGGALPEVAGNAALIVPPANTQALKDAILDLMNNSKKREELGNAGYERVMKNFMWSNAADKTIETYMQTIENTKRRRAH